MLVEMLKDNTVENTTTKESKAFFGFVFRKVQGDTIKPDIFSGKLQLYMSYQSNILTNQHHSVFHGITATEQ